jgi:hypothetical protein
MPMGQPDPYRRILHNRIRQFFSEYRFSAIVILFLSRETATFVKKTGHLDEGSPCRN